MLTEQTILKQVMALPSQNAINVQWANQVLRDGVVISETLHRKAYMAAQADEFTTEVPGGSAIAASMGWTPEVVSAAQAAERAAKAAEQAAQAAQDAASATTAADASVAAALASVAAKEASEAAAEAGAEVAEQP